MLPEKTLQVLLCGRKKARQCRAFEGKQPARLFGADVGSLLALRAFGDIESHALVLSQGTETLRLDGGEVSEEIFATAIRRNEAETLGIVEPLDGTSCHV